MDNKATYPELFFLFMVGSVLGFILEGIWRVIRTGAWENHSATVWGPFCIVYGFGAAAIYWISTQTNDLPVWEQFLIYAIAGATVEYFASLFQELFFGSISWDYSNRFLNINGRICLSMTMMWGLLGLAFSWLLSPAASRFFDVAADWPVRGVCMVLSLIVAADLLLSAGSLIRWRDRQYDIPPKTIVGEQIDERYNDQKMEEIYNNMVFIDKTVEDNN